MEIRKSVKQEENVNSGFIMTYDWLLVLPPAEAIMMAYLIDAEDVCYARDAEDLDFFECTASFIMSKCVGWSTSNITTCLNNLEEKNLILVKNIRTNAGNSRFIKLNRQGLGALKEQYKLKKKELKENKPTVQAKTIKIIYAQS